MHITGRSVALTAATIFSLLTFAKVVTLKDEITVAKGGDSQLQRWSSFIGIITATIGNILISVALNIQRYAHIEIHKERQERKEQSKSLARDSKMGYGTIVSNGDGANRERMEDEQERDPLMQSYHSVDSQSTVYLEEQTTREESYLKSPYWWAGILIMTIGETGNFLAYGFAPASIVSPLGVVALISNCVIAPIMLKEKFRWRDFWGVVVAIGGAVTVVLSAKHQEKKLGPHEVMGAITTTAFEIYMGITITLIAAFMWASPKYGNKTIIFDLGLVGLFGGYTALSTKGVASMLSATLWKAFTTPVTYCLVVVLVGTAIMQVKYVNKALQRFDSTQVIPVQFVMFTLSTIIGSAVLYRDFEKTTPPRAVKFIGGCLLTFLGVFLITSGRSYDRDSEYDEEIIEEGAETIGLAQQDINHEESYYPDEFNKYRAQHIPTILENYDGVNHDENLSLGKSRRSSHASLASIPSRLQIPRAHSIPSLPPSIHLPRTEGKSCIPLGDSPLLANPWKSLRDDPFTTGQSTNAPSMTISSPALPFETQAQSPFGASYPSTTRASTRSNVHIDLDQHLAGPVQADSTRPTTPARHSLARSMLPGPFLSPLSSSLSAIVADTVRRGVDSSLLKQSSRRQRLNIARSKSIFQSNDVEIPPEALHGSSPKNRNRDVEHELSKSLNAGDKTGKSDLSKRSRAKSLSHAIGDFWRGKILKRDEEGESSGGA